MFTRWLQGGGRPVEDRRDLVGPAEGSWDHQPERDHCGLAQVVSYIGSLMLCRLCLRQFPLRKTGKPLNNAIVWCDARNGVQVLVANILAILKCHSLHKVGQLHAKYGQDHLRAK